MIKYLCECRQICVYTGKEVEWVEGWRGESHSRVRGRWVEKGEGGGGGGGDKILAY